MKLIFIIIQIFEMQNQFLFYWNTFFKYFEVIAYAPFYVKYILFVLRICTTSFQGLNVVHFPNYSFITYLYSNLILQIIRWKIKQRAMSRAW